VAAGLLKKYRRKSFIYELVLPVIRDNKCLLFLMTDNKWRKLLQSTLYIENRILKIIFKYQSL